MAVDCEIEIDYDSEEQARNVVRSISLDNGRFAEARAVGRKVVIRCSAPSAPSMLHTVEDLLACVKVADQLVRGAAEDESDPDALPDLDG